MQSFAKNYIRSAVVLYKQITHILHKQAMES